MNLALSIDSMGRIVCDLEDGGENAIATSSDAISAARGLLDALDDARQAGYGECLWPEGGGEYRWMLRRDGGALTCVLLWSRGTVTGWQHLLRTETNFDEFASRIRHALSRLSLADV